MSGDPGARRPLATVGALVVGPSGRVLLIRTHKWRERWGVPGGKIEYGETMAAAVRREVREETGLELVDIRWAPVQEAVESPEFYRPAHFLLLNFVARSGSERVRLNDEAQAFAWVDPKEALEMDLNRPTVVLVRHFLERGFDAPPLERHG
jgi:ADP-ribose pyrophosphatase YjhB (NUDIX family)